MNNFSEASQSVIVKNFYVFCDLDQWYSVTSCGSTDVEENNWSYI
ncbi:hypothetical protein [Okeania sp. SIO2B9]|nr:hypothetical protein [Okeania sp. SIO2B9]